MAVDSSDSVLACEIEFGSSRYVESLALRECVLRAPLGRVLTAADTHGEASQRHFVLLAADRVVACVVFKPLATDRVKLRQMAVAPSWRGRGLGHRLVARAEEVLKKEGVVTIEMAARRSAVDFYRKLGYDVVGDEFEDLGIPHLRMTKRLAD